MSNVQVKVYKSSTIDHADALLSAGWGEVGLGCPAPCPVVSCHGSEDVPKRIGFSQYEENFPGSNVSVEELEFLRAIERYQRKYRRRYPSWREVLGVLRSLGYRKVAEAVPPPPPSPTLTE